MKTPFCESCLATNFFCSGCKQKIESGEASNADLEVAKALYKHCRDLPDAVGFEKAIELKDTLVIFTRAPAALIGKKGKNVVALGKELRKKIRVVDLNADDGSKVKEIILPAALLGINTVFKTSGKEYRVRIARKNAARLPGDLNALQNVLSEVLKGRVTIVFE